MDGINGAPDEKRFIGLLREKRQYLDAADIALSRDAYGCECEEIAIRWVAEVIRYGN